jgi:glycosyltransferase involved in cell wall biosynthesis
MAQPGAAATVVIPAHDEESGLRRLLPLLLDDRPDGHIRIIVVCNGCTDGSADVARSFGGDVTVVELTTASKAAALSAGAALTTDFPVVFVDADVAIDAASVRSLAAALDEERTLAVAPRRVLDRQGVTWSANWYYDIWERLPQVRAGLFGRGVVALSAAGAERVAALPRYISDDLAFSEAFRADERRVVEQSTVTVWPARTWAALKKRRVRVIQGNRELSAAGGVSDESSTGVGDLMAIAGREPRMIPRVGVFVAMTLAARIAERRRRSASPTWLRDETSRG